MLRPAIQVFPRHELASRKRLFDVLEDALGLVFTADPTDGVVATLVLGDGDVPAVQGRPTLRLLHPEPPIGPSASVRLSDSPLLDRALRRQALSDGFAGAAEGLSSSPAAEVLASHERRVLWIRDRSTNEEQAAVVPRELALGEALRDRMRPGAILPLLPLTSFLLRVAESAGLTRAPLRAAFLIDDPNLHRPRYGYLDFETLATRAAAEGWHMAFATIPLDAWYASRSALRWFSPPESRLSLLFHGNNHLKHELGRLRVDERALREMSQAFRRIRSFELRTGVKVSRVMAPPHGVYSPTTARALARLGFGALCVSNAYTWLEPGAPKPPLAGWRPAEFVEGLPILPRHHITGDSEEIVLRAFLRQPLVIYGHHTDAAEGLDVFSDAARRIDSLGNVTWLDLDSIARSNVEIFETRERTLVRLYSRDARIDLGGPRNVVVEVSDLDSVKVEVKSAGRIYPGRGPHEIEAAGPLEVSTRRPDCVDPSEVAAPRPTPWPLTRRLLTETRDRVLPLTRR